MKAITTFFSLFILLFLCLPPFAWSGNGYRLPPLVTDEQKLAFLLEAKNHVPKLFSDAAQYDIDLFKLLDDEQSLVETLKTHPQYDHLFQEKHYYDLTVTPPREGIPIGVLEIKPEAIQAWREELQKTVQDAKTRGLQGPKELKRHIQSLVTEEQAVLLQGAQANLGELGKLPPKPTAEQRSRQRELNACFKEYPELLGKYRCISNHWIRLSTLPGFQSAQLTLEKTQKIIQALEAQDQKMKELHLLAAVHPLPGTPPIQTWDDAERTIAQLNQDRLIHLDDKIDALKPILKDVLGKTEAETLDRALTSVHGRIQSVVNQTQATQRMAKKPVRITQVLPQLGIFRGCTGGDCSSQYSFPYPNDPNEMVFFIDDPTNDPEKGTEKKLKGYVSATQVKLPNGENALYVITISGSKVNAEDTEMILRGLAAKKQELGVSHILLPPIFRQGALINFPEIRGVMSAHARGKREEKIHYNNSDLREKIEKYKSDFNNGKYDHQDQNSSAVELDYKTNPVTVGLVSHEDQRLEPKQLSAYTHEEILEFLMDMNHSNRRDAIAKILKIESLTRFNDVTSLFALLASCEDKKGSKPLSVADLRSNTIRHLEAFNINGEQFLSKHPQYLYPGITRCNDSFEKSHIETTAAMIAYDIKNDLNLITRSNPSILITQRDPLNQTHAFLALKTKLLKQLEDKDNQSIRVASAQAFAIMKPTDPAVYQALVHALHHDQDPDVRISAAEALGEIKPEDPELQKTLKEGILKFLMNLNRLEHNQGADQIKFILGIEGLGDLSAVPDLLELLNTCKKLGNPIPMSPKSFRIEVEADLNKLGIQGDQFLSANPQHLLPGIVRCTDSFKSENIEDTAIVITHMIEKEPEFYLERDFTPPFFERYRDGLNKTHAFQGLNTRLVEQLKSGVKAIQLPAISQLMLIKPINPDVHNNIASLLKDSNPEVRIGAVRALGEIRPENLDIHRALASVLQDSNPEVRIGAVRALGEIKPGNLDVHRALASVLQDSSPEVRIEAVRALGEIKPGNLDVHRALASALQDGNSKVRMKAASLLKDIKPIDPQALRDILKLIANKDNEIVELALYIIYYADVENLNKAINPKDTEFLHSLLMSSCNPKQKLYANAILKKIQIHQFELGSHSSAAQIKSMLETYIQSDCIKSQNQRLFDEIIKLIESTSDRHLKMSN